jgi:hypothetical protein
MQAMRIQNRTNLGEIPPWSNVTTQIEFSSKIPAFTRFVQLKFWQTRYLGFQQVVYTINNYEQVQNSNHNQQPNCQLRRNPKTGKFVSPLHKSFLYPFLLFIVVIGIFALASTPLFGACADPVRNLPFLSIKVVNYDINHDIGNSFDVFLSSFIAKAREKDEDIPTFRVEHSPASTDLSFYQQMMLNGEDNSWGILSINPNATLNLRLAVLNGCSNASFYNPSSAITFSWDEGRNQAVATSNIDGFIRSKVLKAFFSFYSLQFFNHNLSLFTISKCQENAFSNLLLSPIDYSNVNLSPISVSYVFSNIGLTVGNILTAVFASLFIVNITYNTLIPYVEGYSALWSMSLKALTMSCLGLGCAVCYATSSKFLFRFVILFRVLSSRVV